MKGDRGFQTGQPATSGPDDVAVARMIARRVGSTTAIVMLRHARGERWCRRCHDFIAGAKSGLCRDHQRQYRRERYRHTLSTG